MPGALALAVITCPANAQNPRRAAGTIADIRQLLTLIAFISGLMLVVFTLGRFAAR